VEATSAKASVVAASKSAAPTSKRFMVGEHQSAGKQCNDSNRQFLPHDILLMLQRRVALDSSLVHLRPAIFPITTADHVHLLLGWCDSSANARSLRRLAWKGLYSSHPINGLVTLPYSAASAARLTGAPD